MAIVDRVYSALEQREEVINALPDSTLLVTIKNGCVATIEIHGITEPTHHALNEAEDYESESQDDDEYAIECSCGETCGGDTPEKAREAFRDHIEDVQA